MITPHIIGSGFFRKAGEYWPIWFLDECWKPTISKVADTSDIHIVSVGCSLTRLTERLPGIIRLQGNPGHVHNILRKEQPFKQNQICGWSATLCALAMIAYCDEKDLVFVEQDCLCFGPWLERLYADTEGYQMSFGRNSRMPCEQSLLLIKHRFIPTFVSEYLFKADERDVRDLPEARFMRIMRDYPRDICQHNLGPGRDRPIDVNAPVISAQKLTAQELIALRDAGRLYFAGNPPAEFFSSTK